MKISMNQWAFLLLALLLSGCGDMSSDSGSAVTGQSGSLASMTVSDDKLHVLNSDQIVSFDISGEMLLQGESRSQDHYFRARTLANYQNSHLLIGSDFGVDIVKFNHQEQGYTSHQSIGEFTHVTARDPVISDGQLAFFTTRNGELNQATQADTVGVLDIAELAQPELLFSDFSLMEPEGLAFFEDKLFVCDLTLGLSQYQLIRGSENQLLDFQYEQSFAEYPCHDIILNDGTMVLVNKQFVTQLQLVEGQLQVISHLDLFNL